MTDRQDAVFDGMAPATFRPGEDFAGDLAQICARFNEAVGAALSKAFAEHEHLISAMLTRRLLSALGRPDEARERVVVEATPSIGNPTLTSSTTRRTARELVLEALAHAAAPIGFAEVTQALIAEGGSKAAADKIRTRLVKDGAISNQRGLYALTDVGRAMWAGYG